MSTIRMAVNAALLVAVVAWSAACGSTSCASEGDQLSVTLRATPDLNDTGSGPQHVRFRAWAVQNARQFREVFDSKPASLVKDEPRTLEDSGLGKAFPTGSAWITPGSRQPLRLSVPEDIEYTHVGVVVLYPTPQQILVALDCDDRVGYSYDGPVHTITVDLGRNTIAPGAAGEGASE